MLHLQWIPFSLEERKHFSLLNRNTRCNKDFQTAQASVDISKFSNRLERIFEFQSH